MFGGGCFSAPGWVTDASVAFATGLTAARKQSGPVRGGYGGGGGGGYGRVEAAGEASPSESELCLFLDGDLPAPGWALRWCAGVAGRHSFDLDVCFVLQLSGLRWLHSWRQCPLEALKEFTNKLSLPWHPFILIIL